MMTVTDTTCARHDTIGGACSRESNTLRYGHHTFHQHACVDNFLDARVAHGLGKRDLVSNINWFMNVPVGADGTLGIVDGISAPGLFVELRAEMDVLVLISNCPQINNPCNGFDPTPVRSGDHRRPAATVKVEVLDGGRHTTVQDLPGSRRLLARRRAAERSDGRPVARAGQPGRRQHRRTPRRSS